MKRLLSTILVIVMVFASVPMINTFSHLNPEASVAAVSASSTYKTTATLNMRAKANSKSALVIKIPKGSSVKSTGNTSGNYMYVSYKKNSNTYKGWVLKNCLKKTVPTVTYITTAVLNIYSEADSHSRKIIKVTKGSTVKSKGTKNGRYIYVSYTESGKTYKGWVLLTSCRKLSDPDKAFENFKGSDKKDLLMVDAYNKMLKYNKFAGATGKIYKYKTTHGGYLYIFNTDKGFYCCIFDSDYKFYRDSENPDISADASIEAYFPLLGTLRYQGNANFSMAYNQMIKHDKYKSAYVYFAKISESGKNFVVKLYTNKGTYKVWQTDSAGFIKDNA